MKCPFCASSTQVTNSRSRATRVWRRRNCSNNHTFTTYESASLTQIDVKKHESPVEPFQSTKILMSLARCEIDHDSAVGLQQTIIDHLRSQFGDDQQISTLAIATTVYNVLVAYDKRYGDRYASYSSYELGT